MKTTTLFIIAMTLRMLSCHVAFSAGTENSIISSSGNYPAWFSAAADGTLHKAEMNAVTDAEIPLSCKVPACAVFHFYRHRPTIKIIVGRIRT